MLQNFTLLQNELPNTDCLMDHVCLVLDDNVISDIEALSGEIRRKSKLLKTLMINKSLPCERFFRVIKSQRYVGREDLVVKMKKKNYDMQQRGNYQISCKM